MDLLGSEHCEAGLQAHPSNLHGMINLVALPFPTLAAVVWKLLVLLLQPTSPRVPAAISIYLELKRVTHPPEVPA